MQIGLFMYVMPTSVTAYPGQHMLEFYRELMAFSVLFSILFKKMEAEFL